MQTTRSATQPHNAHRHHQNNNGSGVTDAGGNGEQQPLYHLMQVPGTNSTAEGDAEFVAVDSIIGNHKLDQHNQRQPFLLHFSEGNLSTHQQLIQQHGMNSSAPCGITQCYLIEQQHQPEQHHFTHQNPPHSVVIQPNNIEQQQQPLSATTAVQVLNLADGTAAFIPLSEGSCSSPFIQLAATSEHCGTPQLLHTVDGQTIELVIPSSKGVHQPPVPMIAQEEEVQILEGTSTTHHHFNYPTMVASTEAFSPLSGQQQVEPVYVNEKQYARILKRRAARAKLEMEGRIPKQRRKYLHESRHRHAQNRARRAGGKFDSGQIRTSSPVSQHGSEGGGMVACHSGELDNNHAKVELQGKQKEGDSGRRRDENDSSIKEREEGTSKSQKN